MSDSELIPIEVAYAEEELQVMLRIKLPRETSVYDAVVHSGLPKKYPQIDLEAQALGIFGKQVRKPHDQMIKAGDRIEIYRPLPKEQDKP